MIANASIEGNVSVDTQFNTMSESVAYLSETWRIGSPLRITWWN